MAAICPDGLSSHAIMGEFQLAPLVAQHSAHVVACCASLGSVVGARRFHLAPLEGRPGVETLHQERRVHVFQLRVSDITVLVPGGTVLIANNCRNVRHWRGVDR